MMPPVSSNPPRATEGVMREVVETLDQGVAVFDADGALTFANARFRAMYAALSDILKPGLPWTIFLREAVNRGVMADLVNRQLDAIEAGLIDQVAGAEQVQMPCSPGQVYVLRIGQTSDDGLFLTQSLQTDEAKKADAAREAETLLRKVLEACPTSLTMSRVADGQIFYRSPAATELLGTAKSSFAHFAHAEERADFVTLLLPDAKVDNMRITCLRPDGREFPADISARLIEYRGEDVIVANIEDLTDELAIQDEMDRQQKQLFQSEKLSAIGELLAGIAHELNNPLSIIVGNADILHEELENTGLERRIDKLSQAAHRCVRIVRSFLSLVRQEPLDLRPVDPVRLIEAAVEAASADADAASIRLIAKPPMDCPPVVADEVQLVQVIINLLSNAVHAIKGAGRGDQITIDCTHDKVTLHLTVADNGPGVGDDIKKQIFDPLFTTKDVGKGTGVGLAYCQRIVTAHNGQIRLENNRKGPGAAFVITLPLAT